MAITTRAGKGSPLSFAEMDANITQFDTKTKDGWADIVSELYNRGVASSPNIANFRDGLWLYEFEGSTLMEAFASFHIPHSYKQNTMLYPHMHFSVNTNSSGVVRWGFEYSFARRHDSTGTIAYPTTTTLYKEFTIPANSAYTHFVAEVDEGNGIPGTDMEVDGMILMRVFRDAAHPNDTFPDSAFGITADVHHQVDRQATPNRAPNFYAP